MATAIKDAAAPATKSRAKKPQPDQAAPSLAPSTITTVRYADVERAPENVRRTDKAADVESLADDIAAHGLLQSLIGYRSPKAITTGARKGIQPVCIVGGGRRLQALELLHERGAIDDAWPVPVLIRDRADAIELSLSENLARRDMNPADEFLAFAALMAPGSTSPADLAKRFGFTEQYVKQRLRFAALHPDVLDALREGKISLSAAIEYAKTNDAEIQAGVFRALQRGPTYNRDNLYHLKSMLSTEQLRETSHIFRFIDRETYEREGGGYVEDLFESGEERGLDLGRRLSHSTLARTIADRCLQFQATRAEASAKRAHPSVVGCVVEPLTFSKAATPSGYTRIEGGWNSALSTQVNVDQCWKNADRHGVPIQVGVGIGEEPLVGADDDGSDRDLIAVYRTEYFFVPKDDAKRVLPAKSTAYSSSTPVLTPEQQREQQIERDARMWAARLSVPKFSDIPGLDGRVFYERYRLDNYRTWPGQPVSGPKAFSFDLTVYVTEDEIAAHLDAGRARAIEVRDQRERVKAEREAKGAALASAIATISELPEPPAVIMAAQCDDDEPEAWYRWANGDYFDLPEDDEDADDADGTDGLEGLFETMVKVTAWFATRADHLAAS